MKFNIKKFLLFAVLYVTTLFLVNFVVILLSSPFNRQFFPPPIPEGDYEYFYGPFPTVGKYYAVLPPEMLSTIDLKFNFIGIFLSILLFVILFLLTSTKKIKFYTWLVLFAFFSLLVFSISEIQRYGMAKIVQLVGIGLGET